MVRVNVLIVTVLVMVVVAVISCVVFVQQGGIEAVVYGEKQVSPSSWQSCDPEAMFDIACALTTATVDMTSARGRKCGIWLVISRLVDGPAQPFDAVKFEVAQVSKGHFSRDVAL